MGCVAGTIRDENGRAIAAVSVEFRHQRFAFAATTDAEGVYPLNDLPIGDYEIVASREGFAAASATLSVRPAELQLPDFRLQSTKPAPTTEPRPTGMHRPPRAT